MTILISVILLIVGFALLIKGADIFVEGASSLAKRLRVPSMVIGLTIVSIGTSLPEASVSIASALAGSNEISVSNVIGSNIFNILVVAGLSAVFVPMHIDKNTLKSDFPISIIAVIMMILFSADFLFGGENLIGRVEGLILLTCMIAYILLLLRQAMNARSMQQEETSDEIRPLGKSLIMLAVGIAGIVIGGKVTVSAAEDLALAFGMSETLVGLTIIAIGTSLPELVTSIVAIRKGEHDIAMGNVIGSNIFNVFFVLGMSAIVSPLPVIMSSITDALVLLGIMLITWIISFTSRKINRVEGVIMLLTYIVYMAYIIIRN